MTPRDEATERQVLAARPNASTWLSANAGSGKTRVLTDRVARLLLSGVQPQHILCLTYTKAAASEMQNRLFKRLGEWAMLNDADLRAALDTLGAPPGAQLSKARTLFARAIETPGGLKIQTIHSFCASLLRRFPLEARVSPNFTEMEDRAADLLRARIVEDMASGPDGPLIDDVARYLTDQSFDGLTRAICQNAAAFATPRSRGDVLALFGAPRDMTMADVLDDVFSDDALGLIASITPVLNGSGANDRKAGEKLFGVSATVDGLRRLESVLLTGSSANTPFAAKTGSFPTKKLREGALSGFMPRLDDLMRRVEAGRVARLSLEAADKSAALHAFAASFLAAYTHEKQMRGWLDFDDLILKARGLLTDPAVASWVLFRLDGGIDHILVDEAQDTSPAQWDVIERLAQEFTAGKSARDVERTIFVVGDKKQSIYSFQGADPEAFDRMQADFAERLQAAGPGLNALTLDFSFRSSPSILRLVDTVFAGQDSAGFTQNSQHRAFNRDLPGRVDLWPVIPKVEDDDDRPWHEPIDRKSPLHHTVILAETIARRIGRMIGSAYLPQSVGGEMARRPVQPGDIMILVQRRSELFAEIIRACKAAGLPIAGADRLKVGAELAVRDLGALLSFLATPEDDLSLAAALKSPLFGWSEQELFSLAHDRGGAMLWVALRARAAAHPRTMAVLTDLMELTDFLRPYDLIERILTRHQGRRNLLARLGPEAEDGINALLAQALAYERSSVPSLTGFLTWMETDDLNIKREMSGVGNLIRVMTVHGSKGLEAPIVILPDTGKRRAPADPDILHVGNCPMWKTRTDDMPPPMAAARAAHQARQAAERQRLLYVAMTRAESWLITAAAGDLSKDGDTWYQQVEAGLKAIDAKTQDFDGAPGLRLEHGDWDAAPIREIPSAAPDTSPLPALFQTPVAQPGPRSTTLSPSDLGGAKALPGPDGQDEAAAMAHGTAVHLLLDRLPALPQSDWTRAADRLLPDSPPVLRQDALNEAIAVMTHPDLGDIFAPGVLSEVDLSGMVSGHRMHGVADRIMISPDRVLVVDFKTNATVPDTPEDAPEGLLRQMGAYAAILAQIYPDHKIETAILWTRCARFMPLTHEIVTQALARTQLLDVPHTGS